MDSFPPKFQYNWMCGLYSHKAVFISNQVILSVWPDVCMFIALNLTYTLVGVGIKCVLHNSSTKPCVLPRFTSYTRVYYITPARRYETVAYLLCIRSAAPEQIQAQTHIISNKVINRGYSEPNYILVRSNVCLWGILTMFTLTKFTWRIILYLTSRKISSLPIKQWIMIIN